MALAGKTEINWMTIILFVVIQWYASLFCQTFFQHRYAAHSGCRMSVRWERFFFLLSYVCQGPSYLSATAYGTMHRLHHAHADTDKDPHTPLRSTNPLRMIWDTSVSYGAVFFDRAQVDASYRERLPQWAAFDRLAHNPYSRMLWIAGYATFWFNFHTAWWQWLLLPVCVFASAIQGTIINYFGHVSGYRNYELANLSRNLFPFVDLFLMGESYHNNHHRFPGRSNFAVKWFEWDPTYAIMRLLHFFGVIELRKDQH